MPHDVLPADRKSGERRRADQAAAAQRGDRAAYAAMLRESIPLARHAARRAGVSGDLLDDVVQETLVTVHRVLRTYDPTRSFDAWLGAIARRRAVDVLRRVRRIRMRELHEPALYESYADALADPVEAIDLRARMYSLMQAIAKLPPAQREAVARLGLHEESVADAARASGRNMVATKVNLHRALKALRARLLAAASPRRGG